MKYDLADETSRWWCETYLQQAHTGEAKHSQEGASNQARCDEDHTLDNVPPRLSRMLLDVGLDIPGKSPHLIERSCLAAAPKMPWLER